MDLYSELSCCYTSNEACVIPLPETFYLNDDLQTVSQMEKARLLVKWRKLDHSIVVAAISQYQSFCLCKVDILSTFCGVYMVQCVK